MRNIVNVAIASIIACVSYAVTITPIEDQPAFAWPNCAVQWGHNCSVLEPAECKKCVRRWCRGDDVTSGVRECG